MWPDCAPATKASDKLCHLPLQVKRPTPQFHETLPQALQVPQDPGQLSGRSPWTWAPAEYHDPTIQELIVDNACKFQT